MSRFLVACVVFVALASVVLADDVCLPKRHTAWVQQREFSSFGGRKETVFKAYHDQAFMKSRMEFFPRHHARNEEISGFVLSDFSAKLQWRGVIVNSTVHDCGKFFIEGPADGAPYCFARKANNVGSFFLGEDFKVDVWNAESKHKDGFMLDTEVHVQAGATTKVVKAESVGDFTKAPMPAFFVYTEEVFDLNEDGIDPAIFTVPAGCPQ